MIYGLHDRRRKADFPTHAEAPRVQGQGTSSPTRFEGQGLETLGKMWEKEAQVSKCEGT